MKNTTVTLVCLVALSGLIHFTKAKSYTVTIDDNGVEKQESVIVDEDKNVEIFQALDSEAQIVADFDAGLKAIVNDEENVCYVSPLESDKFVKPSDLKSILETNEKLTAKSEYSEQFSVTGEPIANRGMVGETIDEECEGKAIYWLTARERQNPEKRSVECRKVCGYIGWFKVCYEVCDD